MAQEIRVLLIQESHEQSKHLLRELRRGGYDPVDERVETAQAMRAALERASWDMILSDYRLPAFDAHKALQILHDSGRDLPFIIVSGKIGEDLAAAAIKAGAHDFLINDNLTRLVPLVERETREAEQRRWHKRVHEAVVRAKAEWQAVFDAVSDLVFITDAEGVVYRCNGRASSHFGGYANVVGRRIDRLFYGDLPPEGEVFHFANGSDVQVDEELRFPNVDGWYNVASYPMRLEGINSNGYVFIIKDVTKRRQAEEEKRTSDRELLTLYAVAFRLQYSQGLDKISGDLLFQLHNMLLMDFSCIHLFHGGRLVMKASLGVSPEFEKAMATLGKGSHWCSLALAGRAFIGDSPDDRFPQRGKSAAVKMGLRSWCCVPLKIGQEVVGAMTVGTRSGRSYNEREIFLLSAIAAQLAVLIENYNLYDQMKEKAEELYRSKEQLKENLQQVKRANTELGRLNSAKNSFIGIASHELKTPITSVLGGVEFLLKYSGLQMDPQQQSIMTSVYEGAVQLRKLVDDLLSISRIEAHGTLTKKPANLVRICRDAHDLFALPLSERNISVQVAGDETPVPVDDAFARLAVKNLLENAIKFTPDRGEVLLSGRVLKRSQLKGMAEMVRHFYQRFPSCIEAAKTYYLLQVRDTGIGVPHDERVRIFDKFFGVGDINHHSSGSTAFMSKGSGLGLSIVRSVMDLHKGAVWVEGGEVQGSTFSLLFPMNE